MKINLLKSLFLLFCLLIVNGAMAQTRVSGIVTDEEGEPVIGANVIVKGTTQGVATGAIGDFSIAVPANGTLQVSYIGYVTQDVPVANRTQINIKLVPDALAMEDVVVVGYGTQRKVNLTGAVSAVQIDEKLAGRALTNMSSGLTGLVPGLSVNSSTGMVGGDAAPRILIRGLGTVNNSSPLIVVDGMPDVDINRINPSDIESISVLKDAAAAAIYGSRAANGVILVTTKSGRNSAGKTSINFSAFLSTMRPTDHVEFVPDYPLALTLNQQTERSSTLDANLGYKNGTIDQWAALSMIDPLRYPNTDWWKIMIRDGTIQNYNLSASGGNDKSNFFISAGLQDVKGLQVNDDMKRYTTRFNFESKLRKNMNVGGRFDGSWTKSVRILEEGFTDGSTAGGDIQYAIAGITPYDPVTGRFGGVMAYNEDPQAYNPWVGMQRNLVRRNRQEMNASAFLDWNPVKGLVARVDYALSYMNRFQVSAGMPTRAFNFQTNTDGSRIYIGDNAGISNNTGSSYKTQFNTRLNYSTTFGQNHDLSAMAVYSEEFWYSRHLNGSRNDRLYPTLTEIDAALTEVVSASGNSTTEGLRSVVGRVNYAAYGKYLFEANARVDGSSRFLPGHQYGFFPSGAVGWRFSEESFVKSWADSWLSSGKLRASYGSLGNNSLGNSTSDRFQNINDQQWVLNNQNYMVDGKIVKGFVNKKMINEDLSWEKTTVFNLGLDLGFLGNRLTPTIEYFDRLTTGMLRPSEMSSLLTGAISPPRRNIGNLRTRGVELDLTWRDKVGDWSYGVNANFSYNRTILEKWNEYLGQGYEFIDMPYRFVYSYQDIGIVQTWQDIYNNPAQGANAPGSIIRVDKNGDGQIGGVDKVAYPNRQRDIPSTAFSVNLNAAWKGIDASVQLQGTSGRWEFVSNNFNDGTIGRRHSITPEVITEPWAWDNRNGSLPGRNSPNRTEETTFWLDNAAYLRVRTAQLGYTLPNRWLSKVGVSYLRIYVSGENLATFTNYRLLDPESSGSKNDVYPLIKSYSVGINLSF